MLKVALKRTSRRLIVVIENPKNSLYWRTTFFKPLRTYLRFVAHQACAYGSQRPKHTVLAYNSKWFDCINKCCPGPSASHVHKPWGLVTGSKKFATAEETAYPMRLAYTIALFAQAAQEYGWTPPSESLVPPDTVSYHYLRSITGVQPKASKLPPVVSEFRTICTLTLPSGIVPPVQPGHTLEHPWQSFP